MDQVSSTEQVMKEVATGGTVVAVGAGLLWLTRLVARVIGLPKRVAHLEETNAIMLASQLPQLDASLLLLGQKCDDDDEEAIEVKKELKDRKKQILDHLTKTTRK